MGDFPIEHHSDFPMWRIPPQHKEVPAEIWCKCVEDRVIDAVVPDILAFADKISQSGAQVDIRW